jgi:hypothetical protein
MKVRLLAGAALVAGVATGCELPATSEAPEPKNHGAEVSDVARNTDATGRDKGAAVSEAARANGQGEGAQANSAPAAPSADSPEPKDHPENHGAEVSAVAHDTEATGRDKGAAVSEVARNNGQGLGTTKDKGRP